MLEEALKFYKDFPIEGINFVDIVPLMQDREVFGALIGKIGDLVSAPSVAAPEARAFFFSAPLLITDSGVSNIIPFRKKGKLPFAGDDLQDICIMKEYGADHIFFRKSDVAAGKVEDGVLKVAVIDDVLATGGTAEGIAKALEATRITKDGKEYPVKVSEFIFLVELDGLNGRDRLTKIAPVHSIAHVE